ncbi:DEAD/DEAH box helicase family protein, partial [[Clostridium] innocuum]|nr:DEAD/DEAH box helicase family protein [[Clostridium] innocuum]
MDSQIELYPHNQIAYDKLRDMLSQSDRACVIQPTGTGKFVIIAKLVQDNPDKRFLLLGTNDYMFIDQMDNLEKIAPGFHPDNLQFKTYSAAMVHARSEHVTLQYDYIILDEFHHCGAPEWSKGVQWFIDGSPDAKLLGFSATPIRFSDD